jgi:two-component system osmolarity sensor histidine kinase EnvZ
MATTARRFAPRSLLARTLLIMLVPLVAVQAIALQIFYGSHLDLVSRRLSAAVAGEIEQTIELLNRYPADEDHEWIIQSAWDQFSIGLSMEPGARLPRSKHINVLGPMDEDLASALHDQVHLPYDTDWRSDSQFILIRIQMPDGVLTVQAPRKRLYSGALYVFLIWMVGSSLLLFTVAALFMRNQVRAIRRLARAAEAFGMGRDPGPIKPEGAVEVRRAATAFNRMQERILRFLAQRTEMLAGVSHDLRTPLTRLRLALAMLPIESEAQRQDVADMTADVDEMDRMVGAYLAFARGERVEQAREIDLVQLLMGIAGDAQRTGARVDVAAANGPIHARLRPDAIKRAITNLVDNAIRHATRVVVSAYCQDRTVFVLVDDDGPGIPAERRENAFRPFESTANGGTGLGLTIARDIARAHGGDIVLEGSTLGGLRARIRLPV